MNKRFVATVAVASVLSSPTVALADYLYSYTGNSFNEIFGTPPAGVTNISVTFETTQPLATNMTYMASAFSSLSMTDGANCTPAMPCGTPIISGTLSTNGSGDISSWSIFENGFYLGRTIILCTSNNSSCSFGFNDTSLEYVVPPAIYTPPPQLLVAGP